MGKTGESQSEDAGPLGVYSLGNAVEEITRLMTVLRRLPLIAGALFLSVAFALSIARAPAATTGSLNGFVQDAAGHPLADVLVTIVSPSFSSTTRTNARGFYAFAGVPADTYTVSFSKAGFAAYAVPGVTVLQDQSQQQNTVLEKALTTIGHTQSRSMTSLVQPHQTADEYVVTPQREEEITGTPMTIEQSQVLRALPGFSWNSGGAPLIRGGAENDLGYEMEGVDIKDPVLGLFMNNGALAGVQQLAVSTGAFDVASGNSNEGTINEVVKQGTYPGFANIALFKNAGYPYDGIAGEAGGASRDKSLTWYIAYHGVRDANVVGGGNFMPLAVGATSNVQVNETVFNLFYHFGKNKRDQLQYFGETGYNVYDHNWYLNPDQTPYASNNPLVWASLANGNCHFEGTATIENCGKIVADTLPMFPTQTSYDSNTGYPDNENNQHAVQKLEWHHQFSPSSYFAFQVSRAFEYDNYNEPWNGGAFADTYLHNASNNYGFTATYDAQISDKHELTVGSGTVTELTGYDAKLNGLAAFTYFNDWCYVKPIALTPEFGCSGTGTPLTSFPAVEFVRNDPLHRNYVYIRDRWQPSRRWFINAGLRWDNQKIDLPANAQEQGDLLNYDGATGQYIQTAGPKITSSVTNPMQISPRIFATYTMGRNDVLRFGWGRYITFATELQMETKAIISPSLASCNIANGCFAPLPGYGVTNNVTNLYQQSAYDFNTYLNSQYTPVEPEYASDMEFSWEHDWGRGWESKVTPYYRKGTNYVIGSQPIIATLASGYPLYGPYTYSNMGINQNTGVELSIRKTARYGLSGWLNATYDNTLANYNSDYMPTVSFASIALGQFYHVSYAPPLTATLGLDYNTKGGFHAWLAVPYESGFWYGVGKKTFIYENVYPNGQEAPRGGPGTIVVPVQVPNTNYLNGVYGYYTVDPNDPGTYQHPNIIGSKGTPEGDNPGTLQAPGVAIVNLTIAQDFGPGKRYQIGVRVGNLFGNFSTAVPVTNPWYVNNGYGSYGAKSGVNRNAPYEPYQYNYGPYPYESEALGPERQILFFFTTKF